MTRGALVWLVILALLCFGAGVSTGVLFIYRRQAAAQPDRSYADELKKELELTDVQDQKIRTIVAQHDAELERLYRSHQDSLTIDLQRLRKQIDDDISKVLDESQRRKFEGRSAADLPRAKD
jgi:hypothetical protein